MGKSDVKIEKLIDHTVLKADATGEDVRKVCGEAAEHGFHSVCVNGCRVKLASELLSGSGVKVCGVIGFPLGAATAEVKAFEAADAVSNGAREIDMVINVGALKEGRDDVLSDEIKKVRSAIGPEVYLKVILETCLLSDDEIYRGSVIVKESGADCVKTSTGFSKAGARAEDIAIMRKAVGDGFGIKAAGGIRDYKKLMQMVEAGATRIGCSASVAIIEESKKNG